MDLLQQGDTVLGLLGLCYTLMKSYLFDVVIWFVGRQCNRASRALCEVSFLRNFLKLLIPGDPSILLSLFLKEEAVTMSGRGVHSSSLVRMPFPFTEQLQISGELPEGSVGLVQVRSRYFMLRHNSCALSLRTKTCCNCELRTLPNDSNDEQ